MNPLGLLVFYGCIPAIFGIFAALPPRRAVVVSAVAGWLLIPPAGIKLPGLPDYTKFSAINAGIFLAAAAFDGGRLARVRPRWYDLPMLGWCVAPFFSSLSNNLGLYDGLSETLAQVVIWAPPYVVGRAYFDDLEGLRDLAVGIAVGGLAYVPLCLFELRLSPRLMRDLYGYGNWEGAMRFGAYRPRVFMISGLELGMWMSAASLVAYAMWAGRSLRSLRGLPFGRLLLGLVVTTVLCRSSGALTLLALGVGILWFSTSGRGRLWPVWALLALGPLYMGARASELWAGREAVDLSARYLGAARAESLEFRMLNEDVLVSRALERPAFGWGGWNRMMTFNPKTNRQTIPDGLWVIAIGRNGLLGLGSLTAAWLLPAALLLVRCPARRLGAPDVAPAVALAVLLGLTMIDNLSNAMLNPIYMIAAGGLMGLTAGRLARRPGGADEPGASASGSAPDPRADAAARHARRAEDLAHAGRSAEAMRACRLALELRTAVASDRPESPGDRGDLAGEYERVGRILADLGLRAEAAEARRRALGLWEALEASAADPAEARRRRAAVQNDLAWAVVDDPGAGPGDVAEAVRLAVGAAELEPGHPAFWNTLGAAYYRAGAWESAVSALGRSAGIAGQPNAFDLLFLAMAHARRGDGDRARHCLSRGVAAAERSAPGHAGLARLREEAASVVVAPAPTA